MMGFHDSQSPLFYVGFDPESRIPDSHPLRRIKQQIDFSFVRRQVAHCYGRNGHVSVDPVVILKLLFLLFFDDVKSERELMRQLGYRLDYLWFLDFRLDETIANHSVLSKARQRWGGQVFEQLFVQTIEQCVEAGLVDGSKLHMDATLVDADASKDSVMKGSPHLVARLRQLYADQEQKLDDLQSSSALEAPEPRQEQADEQASTSDRVDRSKRPEGDRAVEKVNQTMLSSTDPDAAITRNQRRDPHPRYKHHRAVDDAKGVITSVETTAGDVDEGSRLIALVEQHERHTQERVRTVVADSKYGTIDNFLACDARAIAGHMTDLHQAHRNRLKGIFASSQFIYDGATDTYRCPAGQTMARRRHHAGRQSWDYLAGRGVCAGCGLRPQCTRSKKGRSIKRHEHQDRIDRMRQGSASVRARRDRVRRKYLMEGSFADGANHHHLKRSRWRGLWRQRIQNWLIASVQNVKTLLKATRRKPRAALSAAFQRPLALVAALLTPPQPLRKPFTPIQPI